MSRKNTKLKNILQTNKNQTILLITMLVLIIVIAIGAYLTTPEYFPYRNDIVDLVKDDEDKIILKFGDKVSGYDIEKSPTENGKAYSYSLTTWDSTWNRIINKKNVDDLVLNPNGESVMNLYYYSNDGSSDILLYGAGAGGWASSEGRVTLPRLVLSYYLSLAIVLVIIGLILLYAFRNNEKIRKLLAYFTLLPTSYVLSHFIIKDGTPISYSASRDFLLIIILMIPIYIMFLSIKNFIKAYRYS